MHTGVQDAVPAKPLLSEDEDSLHPPRLRRSPLGTSPESAEAGQPGGNSRFMNVQDAIEPVIRAAQAVARSR